MLKLSVSLLGTYAEVGHEEHCPDINGPGCLSQPVAPQWHALRLFFGELRLGASYGITSWLSTDVMWSLRLVHVQFQLEDLERRPIEQPYGEELHHRTETLVGLSIGLAARLLLTSLNVAGNVIALQTGLGFAIAVDPTQGSHGAIVSTFLVTMGILMLFITGGHAILFDGIFRSYDIFVPGSPPPVSGFLELVVRFVSSSFLLGIELSAPFLVISLVFYAGLGVVAKMMPQFQVFFISMPLSIMGGFGLLMLLIGLMMQVFLDRFVDSFAGLVR